MPLILHIDTATEHASVCISQGTEVLGLTESPDQKNHASFIQPAIEQLCKQCGILLKDLDAVAASSGPGSYTGLRVGLASAKGICYALQKPLILVNTLEVMAHALQSANTQPHDQPVLFCPLIDARRMEVFTAVYDHELKEIQPPQALVLDSDSFTGLLEKNQIYFSGSGYTKLEKILSHPHAHFSSVQHTAADLSVRAVMAYQSNRFADLAYSEPFYVKEFFDAAAAKTK